MRIALAVATVTVVPVPGALAAGQETVLYSFTGQADGGEPVGQLVPGTRGVLYGTTATGGTGTDCQGGCGTVFELAPPIAPGQPWTEKTLYSFRAVFDGWSPQGIVSDDSGALYGTTSYGGSIGNACLVIDGPSGCGTVFKLAPPLIPGGKWREIIIHRFSNRNGDGDLPSGGLLIVASGALYGMTESGGVSNDSCSGCGIVYKLTPPAAPNGAWTEQILYSFLGGADGASPSGGLVADATGVLYGTTGGHTADNAGTVFKLIPPAEDGGGWTKQILYSFSGLSDGGTPLGGVVFDASGALYGTTRDGGLHTCQSSIISCGLVFKLTPPAVDGEAWTEEVLHAFAGGNNDGANPSTGVTIGTNGSVYGTTPTGAGSGCLLGTGCGTVYQLTAPVNGAGNWIEGIVYVFSGGDDGGEPSSSLNAAPSGAFYGVTGSGGGFGQGTAYKLKP